MRVLHCVPTWLVTTQNWIRPMVEKAPGVDSEVLVEGSLLSGSGSARLPVHTFPVRGTHGGTTPLLWRLFRGVASSLESTVLAAQHMGRFDLVHAHFSYLGWRCIPLARKMGVPLVVSFYGFDYESLPARDRRWARRYPRLFRDVDAVLVEGGNGARILERQGCPPERIAISRIGIDVGEIPARDGVSASKGPFRLVQVARISEKKGQDDALKALALAARSVDVHLTLAGDDDPGKLASLTELARGLGVLDRVEFRGPIESAHLNSFLAEFDAFVHPSRYASDRDCEGGAPVVLLQAQACGLPVLSTLHCDIPDEVLDGRTGYLSKEADPAALAANIERIVRMEPGDRLAMSRRARSHVETEFDLATTLPRLSGIYRRVLGSAGKRARAG